jgi:hypothetical protein
MFKWSKDKKKWDIFLNIFDDQLSDLTLRQTLQAFSYFCNTSEDECIEFIEECLEDIYGVHEEKSPNNI